MDMIYKVENILKGNTYQGRGIMIGCSADGKKMMLAYFIMGRSENSRNRVFVQGEKRLLIHPADERKVEDPRLIIYSPVIERKDAVIVSNGDQTETINQFLSEGKSFEEALACREFEPDAPNYTPRISGIIYKDRSYKLSILKKMSEESEGCARYTYSYQPVAGLGHFIHTYDRNTDPLPSFIGEPRKLYIPNDAMDFAQAIWSNLNRENKISLYVRSENRESKKVREVLLNRYERVEEGEDTV